MLRVQKIEGEPTSFYVESQELICTNPDCSKLFKRTPAAWVSFSKSQESLLRAVGVWLKVEKYIKWLEEGCKGRVQPGDKCSKCDWVIDTRYHRVDISGFNLNGICACERFYYSLTPILNKMAPQEQQMGHHRCQHIDAARSFALDVALKAHWYEQIHPNKV